MTSARRHFEFSEGSSNKFWEIWRDGNQVFTRYGKIGAGGQQTSKDEGSPAAALKLFEKLVREKTGKGYRETGEGGAQKAAPARKTATPKAPKSGALTREALRGLKVAVRGTFRIGAAKDLEKALRGLGARLTNQYDEAAILFAGENAGWPAVNAKARVVNEATLAALLGDDLKVAKAARAKRENPQPGKMVSHPADAAFREAFWKDPGDLQPLRVWADSLVERGDLRGEFIQLSLLSAPTEAQEERRHGLQKKLGGQLVGEARPFLRRFDFDGQGLVESATCEAPRLVEGFEQIAALSPLLTLEITSLRTRTLATIAQLVKLPLHRIFYLRLDANGLNDKALAALAPGLEGVRHLSLEHNDLTGDGLSKLAPHARSLVYLALAPSMAQRDQRPQVVAGWVEALCAEGAFPALKDLSLRGGYSGVVLEQAQRKRLEAKFKKLEVSDYRPDPRSLRPEPRA